MGKTLTKEVEESTFQIIDELADELNLEVPFYPEVYWLGRNLKFKTLGLPEEEGKLFDLMASRDIQKMDEAGMVQRVQRIVPEQYAASVIEKYRVALAMRDLPVTPYEIYAAIQGENTV